MPFVFWALTEADRLLCLYKFQNALIVELTQWGMRDSNTWLVWNALSCVYSSITECFGVDPARRPGGIKTWIACGVTVTTIFQNAIFKRQTRTRKLYKSMHMYRYNWKQTYFGLYSQKALEKNGCIIMCSYIDLGLMAYTDPIRNRRCHEGRKGKCFTFNSLRLSDA